jgi:hypothetical protein
MSGLVNQITIQYHLDQSPDQARNSWKERPPEWMAKARYELMDESYNGLSYRADITPLWQRVVFLGLANSYYPLSLRFESNGFGSRVTITGQAEERTAAAIRQDAAANGGGVDPRAA